MAFSLVPTLRSRMRRPTGRPFKSWLYRVVLDPYTNCSNAELHVESLYGFSLDGTLSGVVQRAVFHYGVFEPNLSAWLASTLHDGATFVDVGANVGYFSLLASRLVGPRGRVIALEPSPSNFRALERNVSRNAATNVRMLQVAAFDREASLPLYSIPEEEFTSGASLIARVGPPEAEVRAAPLPLILTPDDLRDARVLKIDVEGAEQEVVRGLLPGLSACSRDLEMVVEVLPKNAQPIVDLLEPFGFHAYALENPMSPLDLSSNGSGRPMRLRTPVSAETDLKSGPVGYLVFSRRDEDAL